MQRLQRPEMIEDTDSNVLLNITGLYGGISNWEDGCKQIRVVMRTGRKEQKKN